MIAEPKFTPGPWHVVDYGDGYEVLVIHRDSENRICFMATPGSYGDPVKIAADARLIASAPAMHDALVQAEAVLSIVEPRTDKAEYLRILGVIREALAKVTE